MRSVTCGTKASGVRVQARGAEGEGQGGRDPCSAVGGQRKHASLWSSCERHWRPGVQDEAEHLATVEWGAEECKQAGARYTLAHVLCRGLSGWLLPEPGYIL